MYSTAETQRKRRAQRQNPRFFGGRLSSRLCRDRPLEICREDPMTVSSEMGLIDDFFEQFPSPTLRTVRPAEAHPEGSLANASSQSPTARRQPPPADCTAQVDGNPDSDCEFGETAKIGSPDRPGLHFDHPLVPRAFENRINLDRFLAPVAHPLSHISIHARDRHSQSRRQIAPALYPCREYPSDQSRRETRCSASRP